MEEYCGGGQGLSWAVEPRREREREREVRRRRLREFSSTPGIKCITTVKINCHILLVLKLSRR
jgi:hypothetical protein